MMLIVKKDAKYRKFREFLKYYSVKLSREGWIVDESGGGGDRI